MGLLFSDNEDHRAWYTIHRVGWLLLHLLLYLLPLLDSFQCEISHVRLHWKTYWNRVHHLWYTIVFVGCLYSHHLVLRYICSLFRWIEYLAVWNGLRLFGYSMYRKNPQILFLPVGILYKKHTTESIQWLRRIAVFYNHWAVRVDVYWRFIKP